MVNFILGLILGLFIGEFITLVCMAVIIATKDND